MPRKFVEVDEDVHEKFEDIKKLTGGVPMKVTLRQMVTGLWSKLKSSERDDDGSGNKGD